MFLRSSTGLTLLFLLTLVCSATAQDFQEKIFTVKDGLPANKVQSLFQDHRGFIWITTDNGLARFDGYTFKVFYRDVKDSASLSDNRTTAITEDRQNRIWIGTYYGGLNCYDPSAQKFTHYYFPPSRINHINLQQVNCLLIDSTGRLWSGNYNGLYYFDSKKNQFIEFPLDTSLAVKNYYNWIISMQTDGHDCLFVVTNHGNLVIDVRSMQSYYKAKNLKQFQILKDSALGNTIHTSNKIYYWRIVTASKRAELCEFDYAKNQSKILIVAPNGFLYNSYNLFNLDNEHLIAAGADMPLIEIDFPASAMYPVSFNHLSSPWAVWVTRPANGGKNIWCATAGGLYLFSEKSKSFDVSSIRSIDKTYKSFNAVDQLFYSREHEIWLASYFRGIAVADSNLHSTHLFFTRPYDSRGYNFIWRMYEDWKGKLWIGRQCGYSIYDPFTRTMKDFFIERHDKTGNNFYVSSSFLQTDDSTIWMGSNKGLAEVNVQNGEVRKWFVYDAGDPENFPLHRVNRIVKDNANNYWLLSDDGLFSFDPITRKFKTFQQTIGNRSQLPTNRVQDVTTLTHQLLIGTTKGFCVLNLDSKRLKTYTLNDGLPNEQIFYVVPENENTCWLVTNSGLSRFDIRTETFTSFNYKDGLPSFEGDFSNLLKLPAGQFMITADSFLIRFDPSRLNISTQIPPAIITEFYADNKSYAVPQDSVQSIQLDWKNRVINVSFSTLQFSDADFAQYQYRLEGIDKEWNNAFTQNQINYSNLPAGNYHLQVRAGYGNGQWGNPALLNFAIAIPFWQAWWFWILAGVVTLSIPALFIWNLISRQRAHILQQLKVNEERQRISSELHDDMGSTLTKIAMMGRAIQLDPEENKNLLPRVTSSADSMVNQMNEIIWALNIRNDTLENLLAFIRKYASDFLEEGKYTLQFEEPDHIPDVALSGEVRRNIFLVVKEVLHNIEKHSEAKCVKFQIALNGELVISIADDGRGISSEKKNAFGNGMINMKQRMKQIHGDLEIISPLENYRGTKIEISFPLR